LPTPLANTFDVATVDDTFAVLSAALESSATVEDATKVSALSLFTETNVKVNPTAAITAISELLTVRSVSAPVRTLICSQPATIIPGKPLFVMPEDSRNYCHPKRQADTTAQPKAKVSWIRKAVKSVLRRFF